ncbi:hypothetical protein TrVE_jg7429 [Triparma verrucosa]|uniref:Uncharacterized protein n=1 Tax=Triparma verrucosa TaxID=1606542 RepID=A0A9W7KWN5_9STRA|nr:hypothetical protein TrVE_jg7429 [Triparma verrucosa]
MSDLLLPKGQSNLVQLNITTPALLEEYVCSGTVNGVAQDFYPYCDFPYVNKGWGDDGEAGYEDVILGDCSLKMGNAFSSGYTMKRLIYGAINVITILTTLRFLQIFQEKRKISNAKHKTINEQLCLLNVTICLAHFVICIDMDSLLFFPYWFTGMLQGYCGAGMTSLAIMLVSSWVTIVDGGKSKKTPPWVSKLGKASMAVAFTVEVIGSGVEVIVSPESAGTYNGTLNAFKGLTTGFILSIWAGVCFKYYLKIATQLKSGASSSGSKMIKKYCWACLFCCALAATYKLLFSIIRLGTTVHTPPPCGAGFVDIISCMFLVIQIACLVAQNPSRAKKATNPTTMMSSKSSTASVAPEN